jgi:hypothetical protein
MSYSQNHVTLIDDLPLLEDIDKPKTEGLNMIPQTEVNKYQKFLRNSGYDPPVESGMMMKKPKHLKNMNHNETQEFKDLPNTYDDDEYMIKNDDMMYNNYHEDSNRTYRNNNYMQNNKKFKYNPYEIEPVHENYEHKLQHKEKSSNQCIDVADHAANCPVCSKLYANNNTIFILIIVFLALVNLLLLKRILETEKH